jgi:aconitate hydratase
VKRQDLQATLTVSSGESYRYVELPRLRKLGIAPSLARLPVSIRVLLESVLRRRGGQAVGDEEVEALARWEPAGRREREVSFSVGRVLLQDFTGVPLVVDLAAMRSAVARRGLDPTVVQARIPVDLVIDHSVQVDAWGRADAARLNMQAEFRRNGERYRFLKWGAQAFDGLRIVPPGFGICHQINLEFLASVAAVRDGTIFFDTLVGTDSHTTMVNGLGVVGWGVGGIEAEAAMLGLPISLLVPDVVGVNLRGRLRDGVTATDLTLRITELLRAHGVVGKFVEFHGDGAAGLTVPDRATIANMAPEYGATIGLFPVDEATCRYLLDTGRSEAHVERVRAFFQAQEMFGVPPGGACDYTTVLDVELRDIEPSIAGPRRPQDRIPLADVGRRFVDLLSRPDGYGKPPSDLARRVPVNLRDGQPSRPGGGEQAPETLPDGREQDTSTLTESEMMNNRPTPDPPATPAAPAARPAKHELGHGAVVIAAITSCTNTSNPSVMLAAGLLARNAVERGLDVPPWVKTSLAPGSRVVSEYLVRTGLQPFLDRLGFQVVGFGCTTCIGNSGPLDPGVEEAITSGGLIGASVLSGNRNFEARVHQSVRANFLMSPPLVVAFALAGRVDIDLTREPLGTVDGREIHLKDIWPTSQEIETARRDAAGAPDYRRVYGEVGRQNPLWDAIPAGEGMLYEWDDDSVYIREPPYFLPGMAGPPPGDIRGARALALFGDSITTDHISPAGAIRPGTPAGDWLVSRGVAPADFNSYGAHRGDHEVMVRGTFANVRIRNLMVPGVEGGFTRHFPDGARMTIHEAAGRYAAEGVPLLIVAGRDYGAGSSRDWAAKGTRLLGVRAVIARSFERIHRANLVGMGVLPLELPEGVSAQTLRLDGSESFDLAPGGALVPRQSAELHVGRTDGTSERVPLTVRIDTPLEAEQLRAGGILPYVVEQLARGA